MIPKITNLVKLCCFAATMLGIHFYYKHFTLLPDTEPYVPRRIFLIESSGSTKLKHRQACAVESAAKLNPDMDIHVLFINETVDYEDELMKSLTSLFNVKMFYQNVAELFENTPLSKWYNNKYGKTKSFKIVHLSDAMRLAVLWKQGGLYMDLDTITQRSLSKLRNFAAHERTQGIGNSILCFDKHHPLLQMSMEDFAENYQPHHLFNNGPPLIDRNVKKLCGETNDWFIAAMNCNVNILPPEAAYLTKYNEMGRFFDPSKTEENLKLINDSFIVHFYNCVTANKKCPVGKNTAFEIMMKKGCPNVHRIMMDRKVTVL